MYPFRDKPGSIDQRPSDRGSNAFPASSSVRAKCPHPVHDVEDADTSQEEFYTPWDTHAEGPDFGGLYDALGHLVVDMYGSTVMEEDEERYLRRIAACVNALAGFSTAQVERMAGAARLNVSFATRSGGGEVHLRALRVVGAAAAKFPRRREGGEQQVPGACGRTFEDDSKKGNGETQIPSGNDKSAGNDSRGDGR